MVSSRFRVNKYICRSNRRSSKFFKAMELSPENTSNSRSSSEDPPPTNPQSVLNSNQPITPAPLPSQNLAGTFSGRPAILSAEDSLRERIDLSITSRFAVWSCLSTEQNLLDSLGSDTISNIANFLIPDENVPFCNDHSSYLINMRNHLHSGAPLRPTGFGGTLNFMDPSPEWFTWNCPSMIVALYEKLSLFPNLHAKVAVQKSITFPTDTAEAVADPATTDSWKKAIILQVKVIKDSTTIPRMKFFISSLLPHATTAVVRNYCRDVIKMSKASYAEDINRESLIHTVVLRFTEADSCPACVLGSKRIEKLAPGYLNYLLHKFNITCASNYSVKSKADLLLIYAQSLDPSIIMSPPIVLSLLEKHEILSCLRILRVTPNTMGTTSKKNKILLQTYLKHVTLASISSASLSETPLNTEAGRIVNDIAHNSLTIDDAEPNDSDSGYESSEDEGGCRKSRSSTGLGLSQTLPQGLPPHTPLASATFPNPHPPCPLATRGRHSSSTRQSVGRPLSPTIWLQTMRCSSDQST